MASEADRSGAATGVLLWSTNENSTRFGPQTTGDVMRIGTTLGVVGGCPQPSTLSPGDGMAGHAAELLAAGDSAAVEVGASRALPLHAAAASATHRYARAPGRVRRESGDRMGGSLAGDLESSG